MRSLPFTGGDTELRQELEKLADPGYKTFHEGLIPGASMSYGVRLPDMRALAQKVLRGDPVSFLKSTHPASYEETMVRGLVVAGLKLPWEEKRPWVEDFLPRVDNWAVCDSFCNSLAPRFPGDGAALWDFLRPLYPDSREYYARVACVVQLSHFVDSEHLEEGLSLLQQVKHRLLRQDGRGLGAVGVVREVPPGGGAAAGPADLGALGAEQGHPEGAGIPPGEQGGKGRAAPL